MGFLFSALFFLLLALLGAALFSIAAGFCIYPAVKNALIALFAACDGAPDNDGIIGKAELREIRSLFVSKKIRIRRGRRALSGWVFLPAEQRMSPKRILILAPEGRALSARDLGFFLKAGFLDRAGCGGNLRTRAPAVFLPSPAEHCETRLFFSFGKKEAASLAAWALLFSRDFPSTAVLFCGKGLGALSALFAAARLARRTAKGRLNLGGVIADLPCLSAAQSMESIIKMRLPRRALYIPIYAGVRFASVFCGLGIGGRNVQRGPLDACAARYPRNARRAVKRLLALKKRHSDIIIGLEARADSEPSTQN